MSNVGRPALRAVVSPGELKLAAVVVPSPSKEGEDAGSLAGLGSLGVMVTRDLDQLLAQGVDAMAYSGSGG